MHKLFLLKKSRVQGLEHLLKGNYDFENKKVNYGSGFELKDDGLHVNVNFYHKLVNGKKKILVQGSDNKLFHRIVTIVENYIVEDLKDYEDHIGVDESGKGDYFGPLVVAGALVDHESAKSLLKLGVQDSKKLKDDFIDDLAQDIRDMVPWTLVKISPERYNQLYRKIQNVNKLLGWGHARAIENILEKDACDLVVLDKFSKIEGRVLNSLMERGRKCKIIQIPHGESDIAVAAASIIARAEFVKSMKEMSEEYDMRFPLGATHVKDQIREFKDKYGEDRLNEVAKVHFAM
jgi:ribonuclease HIII